MIIYKVIFPIFLFVRSELAEEVPDPCSDFWGAMGPPLVKCPSDKPDDDYLECYDLWQKGNLENINGRFSYWCWSRLDNNYDDLENLPISAGYNHDSEFNEMINRPFTANFYINETHITCTDYEEWWITNPGETFHDNVHCPTSTGIPVASFIYYGQKKL